MSAGSYTVNRPIKMGKKLYPVGKPIELDDETAEHLLASGAVSDPDAVAEPENSPQPGGAAVSADEADRARRLDEAEAEVVKRIEALGARATSLDQFQERLDTRHDAQEKKEGELDSRAADLDKAEAELKEREENCSVFATELDDREKAVAVRENGVNAKESLMGVADFRAALGKAAIRGTVASGEPDSLTANGAPKTERIEILSGLENITAKERDAWFKELYPEGGDKK